MAIGMDTSTYPAMVKVRISVIIAERSVHTVEMQVELQSVVRSANIHSIVIWIVKRKILNNTKKVYARALLRKTSCKNREIRPGCSTTTNDEGLYVEEVMM
mmetsp:Transcript_52228/g.53209  ORF Transcript_52228/g.53209 Transcript_52228/m.53209 type:complete len:101 (-) Transcript_52228:34-336(-)